MLNECYVSEDWHTILIYRNPCFAIVLQVISFKDSVKYSCSLWRESRSIRQQAKLNGKVHEILRDRNTYYFMLQPNIYQNYFFKYLTDEREAKEM